MIADWISARELANALLTTPLDVVFVTCFILSHREGLWCFWRRQRIPLYSTRSGVPAFLNLLMQVPSLLLLLLQSVLVSLPFLHATVLLWLLLLPFTIAILLLLWLPRQHLHSDCQWWREVQLIPSQGGGSGLARPAIGISRRFLYVLCKKEKVCLHRIVSVSPF